MKTLEGLRIGRGAHSSGADSKVGCAMELQSYLAGERWSDEPQCVHPVIAMLARHFNDNMSDADLRAYMLPFVESRAAEGTRGTQRTRRMILRMADIAIRQIVPHELCSRNAPTTANMFRELPAIVDKQSAKCAEECWKQHNDPPTGLTFVFTTLWRLWECDECGDHVDVVNVTDEIARRMAVEVRALATSTQLPASECVAILYTLCGIAKGTTP